MVWQAPARPVDAGTCNGHYFINRAGIGFDGEVVQATGKKRFISARHWAYLWTVFRKIIFYREKQLLLQFDGQQSADKYFLLTIANASRYGGGFMVAPGSRSYRWRICMDNYFQYRNIAGQISLQVLIGGNP